MLTELDGSFSCLAATEYELGFVKDPFALKPLLYTETDDFVAVATEEIAIRAPFPGDYDGPRSAGQGSASMAEIDAADAPPARSTPRSGMSIAEGSTEIMVRNPGARHNLAVAILNRVHIRIAGSVGYYCGGLDRRSLDRNRGQRRMGSGGIHDERHVGCMAARATARRRLFAAAQWSFTAMRRRDWASR